MGVNFDPEYAYLLTSAKLADLESGAVVQHPGVPTLIVGAAIIWFGWIFDGILHGFGPRILTVLSNHEGYLEAIAWLLTALIAVAFYLAGRRVYRLTGSLLPMLALQISPFLSFLVLQHSNRVSPEPVEILLAPALVMALAPPLFGSRTDWTARTPAMVAGALVGVGIASKYNFVTLAILALLFPGIRRKMRFVCGALLSFVLLMIPVFPKFTAVVSTLWVRLWWTGGSAPATAGPGILASLVENLRRGFAEASGLYLFLLLYAVVFLFAYPQRRPATGDTASRNLRLLGVGMVAIAAHILLTALPTSPAPHYRLPALALTFLVNPSMVELLRTGFFPRGVKPLLAAATVAVTLFALNVTYQKATSFRVMMDDYRQGIAMLEAEREKREDCTAIGFYRSSVPGRGLAFGNFYTGGQYGASIEQVYPDVITFHRWRGGFWDWSLSPKWSDVERQVAAGHCVLVQGELAASHEVFGWQLRPVAAMNGSSMWDEGLWRLSLDANRPSLISAAAPMTGALVLSAAEFASGNLAPAPDSHGAVTAEGPHGFAEYEIDAENEGRWAARIRYASGDARPLKVRLNGEILSVIASPVPTGGFSPEHFKWHSIGALPLREGSNTLRLEGEGPFPYLDKIAVRRIQE
ncbi:MAG: hypothetical protein GY953_48680 [bacterium]|nr:hypothetical protein [bacterium]